MKVLVRAHPCYPCAAARLGLVYLVLSRSLDLASEQEAIWASERELQTIDGK